MKTTTTKKKSKYPYFVICIDECGEEGSLKLGKVYQVVKPVSGDVKGDVRVIDEECEDYIYCSNRFVKVSLPPNVEKILKQHIKAKMVNGR